MNQVKLFEGQEVKIKTDKGNIMYNLVHVAKCCGLTRKDKGYKLIRWKAKGSIVEKLNMIFDENTSKEIQSEITYILDEIENTDDRNTIYISSWLAKRLAIECHSKKANEFKNWLVNLDEVVENKIAVTQDVMTNFVSTAMTSAFTQLGDYLAPKMNELSAGIDNLNKNIENMQELNGLKTIHIRVLSQKIKNVLSEFIGKNIYATNKNYKIAKNKIFDKFNICKWEDLSVKRFNETCEYINNNLINDIKNKINVIENKKDTKVNVRKRFVTRIRKDVEVMEIDGKKYIRCTKCGKIKELNEDNFYKDESRSLGYIPTCKECKKEYYQLNRKERLGYQNDYAHNIKGVIPRSAYSYNKGFNNNIMN